MMNSNFTFLCLLILISLFGDPATGLVNINRHQHRLGVAQTGNFFHSINIQQRGDNLHRISIGSNIIRRKSASSISLKSNDDGNNLLSDDTTSTTASTSNAAPKILLSISGIALIVSLFNDYFCAFDATTFFENAVNQIHDLGPLGYVYFALLYIVAEVFAVPALPLTASSGYLFGLGPGFLTVLTSATIAASISFYIGRTFLYTWAQKLASGSDKWKTIDYAVSKEGFKMILLLRLSPFLPFALSNYLYGITSVDYWSYITGTFLGFAPGTFAIVYAGSAGKALFSDGVSTVPWYGYAVGGLLIVFLAKYIASVASASIKAMEEEQQQQQQDPSDNTKK